MYCQHPTANVHYYSEIDDEGDVHEEYWCDACNRWLTTGAMGEIRMRPDWNGGLSD